MLIGGRICLGPMFQADGPIIFNWRNRLDVLHLDGLYRPLSQGGFDEWFSGIGRDPTRVVFSIRRKTDLNFLGYVQITSILPAHCSAEVGIMIGEQEHRGQGYGQEALRLCVEFCWKELNLQRLWLRVIGDNPAAVNAYRRVGFEHEGLQRRSAYVDGQFRDTTLMALLRPS
jgi:RimJ/RimL family protein N-acetyltransferase